MMTADENVTNNGSHAHTSTAVAARPAHDDLLQLGVECMQSMLAALNTEAALSDVLSLVAVQALKWMAPDAAMVGKLDPATQTLVVQVAQGAHTDAGRAALLAWGMRALSDALAARRPVLCPEHALAGADRPNPVLLAVPLLDADDLPYGGVFLCYTTPPQLSVGQLELAALLGSQATLAIRHRQQQARAQTLAILGERNRIASDLHDSVTQALYTISLIAETLPAVLRSHPAEVLQSTETLKLLAQGALAEMRALLLELRPVAQPDCNLDERLRQLPDRLFLRSPVQITTTAVGNASLPEDVQTALYRIAQEALNNVDKHAKATRAALQLHHRPDGTVMLRISDNGCGIDPNQTNPNQLGLSILRERAQKIGAVVNIISLPGQGTQVTVEWDSAQRGQTHGAT